MKNQFENYVVLYKITELNGRSFVASEFISDHSFFTDIGTVGIPKNPTVPRTILENPTVPDPTAPSGMPQKNVENDFQKIRQLEKNPTVPRPL